MKLAKLAGVLLAYEQTIPITQQTTLAGQKVALWQDPQYASIRVGTPDVLEKSLFDLVAQKRAKSALLWYRNEYKK